MGRLTRDLSASAFSRARALPPLLVKVSAFLGVTRLTYRTVLLSRLLLPLCRLNIRSFVLPVSRSWTVQLSLSGAAELNRWTWTQFIPFRITRQLMAEESQLERARLVARLVVLSLS